MTYLNTCSWKQATSKFFFGRCSDSEQQPFGDNHLSFVNPKRNCKSSREQLWLPSITTLPNFWQTENKIYNIQRTHIPQNYIHVRSQPHLDKYCLVFMVHLDRPQQMQPALWTITVWNCKNSIRSAAYSFQNQVSSLKKGMQNTPLFGSATIASLAALSDKLHHFAIRNTSRWRTTGTKDCVNSFR